MGAPWGWVDGNGESGAEVARVLYCCCVGASPWSGTDPVLLCGTDNPTRESVERKRKENQERYGLSASEIEALVVPVLKQADSSVVVVKSVLSLQDKGARRQQKYDRMRVLTRDLARLEAALQRLEGSAAADDATDLDGPERASRAPPVQPAAPCKLPAEAAPKAAKVAAKAVQKTAPKAAPKAKADKTRAGGASKRSQQQLDEDADAALARRLQMEEGGFDDDMMDLEEEDDDFKPTRAKKRGSARKKNKSAARDE